MPNTGLDGNTGRDEQQTSMGMQSQDSRSDGSCFPECRRTLADYLKDLRSVEGGDRQLTSWLKEEGFHTSLRSVSQARCPPCRHAPHAAPGLLILACSRGLPALNHPGMFAKSHASP